MPPREYYIEQIEKEFAAARKAFNQGNAGKARVCARRAAGQAIAWFLSKYPRSGWGTDAMSQLNSLTSDQYFPENVRDAASRLTIKITDQFTYPFSTDPISDGSIIAEYVKQVMESNVS